MSPFWFSLCRWPCLERSPAEPVGRSVQGAAEGWANDAERLSQDPTFRLISSEKVWDQGAALTSRLQTFVTEMLAEEENFAGLARALFAAVLLCLAVHHNRHKPIRLETSLNWTT